MREHNDSTTVYTAVPAVDNVETGNQEEEEPFSSTTLENLQSSDWRDQYVVTGAAIGALFYMIVDFSVLSKLDGGDAVPVKLGWSLLWGGITSLAAQCVFALIWSGVLRLYRGTEMHSVLSYGQFYDGMMRYYWIGVFVGYLLACLMNNFFVQGYAVITFTYLLFICLWVFKTTLCASCQEREPSCPPKAVSLSPAASV